MESLLYEVRKDAFEKARGARAGEQFFGLIYRLVEMAKISRKEGLLSLEEALTKASPEIGLYREIRWIGRLVCEGCDPDNIIEFSAARYWSSNFQGEDALLYYMLISGFLKIQGGISQHNTEQFLTACLSFEAAERYEDYRQRREASELAAKLESLLHHDPVFEDQGILEIKKQMEEKIEQADDKTIQRVLRDVGAVHLDIALHGLSPAAKQKILSNISEKVKNILVEGWEEKELFFGIKSAFSKMLSIFDEVGKKQIHT